MTIVVGPRSATTRHALGPQPRSSGCSLQDFNLVSQGEVLEGQLLAGA
jgi:hypothetical protein